MQKLNKEQKIIIRKWYDENCKNKEKISLSNTMCQEFLNRLNDIKCYEDMESHIDNYLIELAIKDNPEYCCY